MRARPWRQWFQSRGQRNKHRQIKRPRHRRSLAEILEQKLLLTATFRVAEAAAYEDSGALVVSVFREQDSSAAVSVDLLVADLTARSGEDFGPMYVTVGFTPGQTIQNVTVALTSDRRIENNEELVIKLLNPLGVRSATAKPSAASLMTTAS
jgi:hypothetical protein